MFCACSGNWHIKLLSSSESWENPLVFVTWLLPAVEVSFRVSFSFSLIYFFLPQGEIWFQQYEKFVVILCLVCLVLCSLQYIDICGSADLTKLTSHNSTMVLLRSTHTAHTTVLLLFWNYVRTPRVSRYQKGKTRKVKTNLDLLEQEIVSGSGICWAICKSGPHPRQPCQHPTTQFFTGRMPFLPPNQQRQSTEGNCLDLRSR